MSDVLNVSVRELKGSANSRRMRIAGQVPGVLYGLGKDNVCLSLSADELSAVLRHGGRVVDLAGDVSEAALIREVQWDAFGAEVLHLDLVRVDKSSEVEATVQVELRGVAPGTSSGGVVEHQAHEISVRANVTALIDKVSLSINSLELGQSLKASDIELPEGVVLISDADAVVVQCVEPAEETEPEEGAMMPSEPEVIGRKAEDEEE